MSRPVVRVGDVLPDVVADLISRHTETNGEPPTMPATVWRYPLPLADRVTLDMPAGARPLSIGPFRQPARSGACSANPPLDLWAHVDPTQPPQPRTFLIVGTGNPIPADAGAYVGTTHSHGGALIWHVFEASDEIARGAA